jgi:hypothetical protein
VVWEGWRREASSYPDHISKPVNLIGVLTLGLYPKHALGAGSERVLGQRGGVRRIDAGRADERRPQILHISRRDAFDDDDNPGFMIGVRPAWVRRRRMKDMLDAINPDRRIRPTAATIRP